MNDTINKITAWIKNNVLIAVLVGLGVVFIFAGKYIKKFLFGTTRRRKRRTVTPARSPRRRSLPRSVGTRPSGKGYPAAGGGTIPFKYNKDGTIKKAWQVGGTVAAKNRMSRLRKNK